jgi:hypothetical protein
LPPSGDKVIAKLFARSEIVVHRQAPIPAGARRLANWPGIEITGLLSYPKKAANSRETQIACRCDLAMPIFTNSDSSEDHR